MDIIPHWFSQKKDEGTYRNDQPNLNTSKDNTKIGTEADTEVDLVNMPEMDGCLIVNKTKHG